MIEDKYRKKFIEDFSKKFEIDLENRVIEHYMYEVIKEKDQIIEEKDKVINELLKRIADLEYEVEKCMNS